jgi:hypothetical protein
MIEGIRFVSWWLIPVFHWRTNRLVSAYAAVSPQLPTVKVSCLRVESVFGSESRPDIYP